MPAAVSRILPLLVVGVWSVAAVGCGPGAPAADSRPQPVAPLPAPGPTGGGDGAPHVDVSVATLLDHAAPAILERRNPFRFGPAAGDGWPPGTPGSLADLWGPAGGAGAGGTAPDGTTASAVLAPESLDPLDGLRLIGFVETREAPERVAVLTDGDGVFYGLVDDVVRGRYRVLSVGPASVEIEDVARGTRRILRLPWQ